MKIPIPELWVRDWEFLFRSADLLWAKIGDQKEVFSRRTKYCAAYGDITYGSSGTEARRFSSDFTPICDWIAERWCRLFDDWIKCPETFVFDDAFAALFLIRILWANQTLLLRGHYDSRWKLTTSSFRAMQGGDEFVKRETERAQQFLFEIMRLDVVKTAYPSGILREHQQAILQHYGFPTDLIDTTFSYDIALYFAEGAYDYLPGPDPKTEFGAIYAFPTTSIPKSALVITIHPAIMRPSLQRGAFISGLSDEERLRLEKFKFVFKHQSLPVWNGIGAIYFAAPVGLGKYLFPVSDPLERIAKPVREILFSDTPAGVWLSETINYCLGQLPDGRGTLDLKLLIQMIKGEPLNAQTAMWIFASELKTNLGGKPVSEATGMDVTWRLLLGSIYLAYSISQHITDRVPPDLEDLVESNPIISECATFVAKEMSANTDWIAKKRPPQ